MRALYACWLVRMSNASAEGDSRASRAWLSLRPLGLGAWAPLCAGVRARNRRWCALGAVWPAITLAGWIVASRPGAPPRVLDHFGLGRGDRIVVCPPCLLPAARRWLTFRCRSDRWGGALERARASEAARRDWPAVERRIGIGRPDSPNAQDGGLTDIKDAPTAVRDGWARISRSSDPARRAAAA